MSSTPTYTSLHMVTTTYTSQSGNTVIQPFYILSIVVGSLIGFVVFLLIGCGCYRRRRTRRRFENVLREGRIGLRWDLSERQMDDETEGRKKKEPIPAMKEVYGEERREVEWEKTSPLSLTALPPHQASTHQILLSLLTTPSLFNSHLLQRLKAIDYIRHSRRKRKRQTTTSDIPLEEKSSVPEEQSEAQVLYLISMPRAPNAPKSPLSPTGDPTTCEQDLALGSVSVLWTRPSSLPDPEESEYEEDSQDYASTLAARREINRQRAFYPSAEQMLFMTPSQLARRAGSASVISTPYLGSYISDISGERGSIGEGGSAYEDRAPPSTYETHNSFLAPPSTSHGHGRTSSRPYTPSTRSISITTQRVMEDRGRRIDAAYRAHEGQRSSGEDRVASLEREFHPGSVESRPTILELHVGSWESRPWSGEGAGVSPVGIRLGDVDESVFRIRGSEDTTPGIRVSGSDDGAGGVRISGSDGVRSSEDAGCVERDSLEDGDTTLRGRR